MDPLPRQVRAVQQHPVVHLRKGKRGFLTVMGGGGGDIYVAIHLKDARTPSESTMQSSVVIGSMRLLLLQNE